MLKSEAKYSPHLSLGCARVISVGTHACNSRSSDSRCTPLPGIVAHSFFFFCHWNCQKEELSPAPAYWARKNHKSVDTLVTLVAFLTLEITLVVCVSAGRYPQPRALT